VTDAIAVVPITEQGRQTHQTTCPATLEEFQEKGRIMFNERMRVRMILALLTGIAVASAWQIEASEPASCRMRSMRRSNRMTRRASTENSAVAAEPSKEAKKDSAPQDASKLQVTGEVRAVVRSSNNFAFELYERQHEQDGNKFFSPASIATALAMTYAGARDETKKQMAQVLHFDLDPYGLALSGDGRLLAVTGSGTHELLVFAGLGIAHVG
jgi:Serpin (serine protease inhibitor)